MMSLPIYFRYDRLLFGQLEYTSDTMGLRCVPFMYVVGIKITTLFAATNFQLAAGFITAV